MQFGGGDALGMEAEADLAELRGPVPVEFDPIRTADLLGRQSALLDNIASTLEKAPAEETGPDRDLARRQHSPATNC